MTPRKKLIEVALPLEAINKASAREKAIRHGHPSTLLLWWARRPLAAARAVIFAQMVDDPSSLPDLFPTEKKQQKERERLFRIIEDLVQWESTTNEEVLDRACAEIWQSWRRACAENADHPRAKGLFDRRKLPAFHDPFAGGGSLPLEAQRLGLEAYASDLNPVAVLICKAMIEIPPRFAGKPPVNPVARKEKPLIAREWKGAHGLAEDARFYGQWMRDEAEKRIGHLYPPIEVTAEMLKVRPDLKPYVGQRLTVIAWLWARTVRSPNPAFAKVDVPLVSSFILTPMAGKETYVEPVIENGGYRFTVKLGTPKDAQRARSGTKLSRGANFECLLSGTPIAGDYIKAEGKAGRIGARLMAIVAEGQRGRVYLAPTVEHEAAARKAKPEWKPEVTISGSTQYLGIKPYGMDRIDQLFTDRQLVALKTFSDLVGEATQQVHRDALAASWPDNSTPLRDGGAGAMAYAESVATYLGFLVGKLADKGSTLCMWDAGPASNRTASGRSARAATVVHTFGRQALPMTWDFAEVNFFSEAVGSMEAVAKTLSIPLMYLPKLPVGGKAEQHDARNQTMSVDRVVSTDPPYYDNVPYADLSDFFYVWLRHSLRTIFPNLFATVAVPKTGELVAFAYRHDDGKPGAEAFFLDGMTQAMHRLVEQAHPAFPVTIYYAFRQAETETDEGTSSTGWETFLSAVLKAGFAVTGTWPMRTELRGALKTLRNALASSIVLVCRRQETTAHTATRREFVSALKAELPTALRRLQEGNIAPVDLAQAAIGPGMAVYTRFARVLDAEGKPVPVREALALINQVLDETLAEQEGDFDPDTRFALAWFEQLGFAQGEYGVAETLSKAKNTSVSGLAEAGILESKRGKVRLLKPSELPADWAPASDARLTNWETVHHLIRVLEAGGEGAAAALVAKLGSKAETARELAYRLYTVCERRKRAAEALSYNALVQSFPEITRLAREAGEPRSEQAGLFSETEE
jgi:putative DNA methylase